MLHVKGGWLYYGEAKLPLRFTLGGLEFAVKEKWLRHEYGDCVVVPIGSLLKLWVSYLVTHR